MAPLRRQLTKLFTKYPVDLVRKWTFDKQIQEQFIKSFSVPIPIALEERLDYEKQMIQSIQYQLKRNQLILRRTADGNNTYYLGHLNKFNQMANDYLQDSSAFEIIGIIDELNTEQQQLNEILKSIDLALEQLQQQKMIHKDYVTKFQLGKKANINLPYLYFLPDTRKYGPVLLRPRLSSCKNAPIQTLASYLDQLLRSLLGNVCQSTTFTNGNDFIRRFQHYCQQGDCLQLSTNLMTFQIHNLYTRVSHDDLLTALNQFLVQTTIHGRHQRLTIDAIEALTALVLRNNIFTYHGKIYRYIRGSPLNLALTNFLGNIYLHYWQVPLVREIRLANQFYGRYYDTGFLTWNGPTDKLVACLSELNEKHPDIQITISSIDSHIHFLNAYIENRKGNLYTRVYHDLGKQPFLLPYVTGHPRLIHRQWFRFTLLRAAQYCSTWEDFNEERLYIELTFLANGYSLDFVEYHLRQFFIRFNPNQQQHIVLNRWTYPSFRMRLFRYLDQQQQLENKQPLIQLSYLFDWGSRCEFNRKFYELWTTILNEDPNFKKFGIQIKLNSKHYYLSNTLFMQ